MGRILRILIRITLVILAVHESNSLRNVRLAAPQSAERNAKVVLKCLYELENENLYTVKWYRGDREFCRYSPGDSPQVKVFMLPGIEVVNEETDENQLTMKLSHPQSIVQGKYTCEVSADVPSFQTARVHTFIYVVDLPRKKLELHGMKPKYKPGMKLKVECICRNSLPPVNLTFYVNDHAARSQHVTHRVDGGGEPEGLMTAYSVIQFVVQKHHFHDNRLRIRCVSEIYDIYYWSSERCSLEEVIRSTPSSVLRQDEMIVIPINRKKKTPNVSGFGRTLAISPIPFTVIPIIALILPTVLR